MVYNVHKNEYNCRIIGSWKSDNIRAFPNPIAQPPNVLPKSINPQTKRWSDNLRIIGLSEVTSACPTLVICV